MAVVFQKPKALTDVPLHYCPGCPHGIIHRLVAEVIDELGIEGKTIGVAPVGCAVMAYDYFACDMIEAAHGRAPAVATGVKRANPDEHIVFTYQGDGWRASNRRDGDNACNRCGSGCYGRLCRFATNDRGYQGEENHRTC